MSSSEKLSIISPAGCIKRLERLPDGKTPLWVKTFPDIVEYFGKFGTISDVGDESKGISKITFFEKSSAVKALSSSHKQLITFYKFTTQVAGHHDVEDRLSEADDSRVKALENYEADVNSFLFGTEDLQETSTATHSGTKKVKNNDLKIDKDDPERKVSASLYSRRSAKIPKFYLPHGKVFEVEADLSFVKKAENNKWKIAVEKFESMKDEAHVKFDKKFDKEHEGDGGSKAIKNRTTVKAARVPNILERKLLAMAGSYEDPSSRSGKVVLRSRNSDENNTELVDIADSDEEVVEVMKSEKDYQNKLLSFEKASDEEKEGILKSMGIVSRDSEPLVLHERELVDLGDSVAKDSEPPPVMKTRKFVDISDGDCVDIIPPVSARELVDLSESKDTEPPDVETRELTDSSDIVVHTDPPVMEGRECVNLSDSDTGLYSDGSEGMG